VIPERLVRAVELLDPAGGERILEIGSGPGVAAALICERLRDGHLTAIDRSATAIDRATRRNAAAVAAGRLDLRHIELAQLTIGDDARFDAALAVNVNLFWTGPADAELAVISRVLRPGGRLVLVYETPSGTLPDQARQAIERALAAHGFTHCALAPAPVLAIVATRSG
jgi:SAM-dependent methyltransferase